MGRFAVVWFLCELRAFFDSQTPKQAKKTFITYYFSDIQICLNPSPSPSLSLSLTHFLLLQSGYSSPTQYAITTDLSLTVSEVSISVAQYAYFRIYTYVFDFSL